MKLLLRRYGLSTLTPGASLLILLLTIPTSLSAQIITTVAGSTLKGDGGAATSASLSHPSGVAIDGSGNLYIADQQNHRIRKVATSGIITTVAGTGDYGFSGDGGLATAANLANPTNVVVDGSGNLYIADYSNHRIRKVSTTGIITTVAGNGTASFSGDGGAATMASLNSPSGVAVDGSGNLYIADGGNNRIRKVSTTGIITTVAGTGTASFSGDGGLATAASLNGATDVVVDGAGNFYIADYGNHRIRKVSPAGVISTVAGNGSNSFSGDGGAATVASLDNPSGVAVDGPGNLYIADQYNHRIRKVSTAGIITTVAGNDSNSFSGDGGAATSASLYSPTNVVADGSGNLYIADYGNHRIRKVSTMGIITTIVGNGSTSFSGDGGAATVASLNNPHGVALDGSGNVYIADLANHRIRKVATSGIITTVAGTGDYGFSGDGGLATAANLANPTNVVVDGSGNLYIADYSNHRIRKVSTTGIITTVAGNGTASFSGDGGAATMASLNSPSGVAVDGSGNLYIADGGNNRIRKVSTTGIITTVAGTGTASFSGDGGLATAASLNGATDVVVDGAGNFYIADYGNHRIRKVSPAGVISTVAGNGSNSFSGDGGAATMAGLNSPYGVAVDGVGNLYIADQFDNRIRKVSSSGIISTVAGNGVYGFSGDGGAAIDANLTYPTSVAVDGVGNFYIADSGKNHIRKVTSPASVSVSQLNPPTVCSASTFSLTATAANFSPTSYTWSSQPTGLSASGATPTFIAPSVNMPTVYTLTVTATDGSVSPMASITLTINPTPASSLTITANPSLTITGGQATTLTATGANTYVWSTSDTTPSIIIHTAGVYSVTGTAFGCSSQTNVTVYGVITSVQDGNWLSTNTWNCTCLPTLYDTVTISIGHHITISEPVRAQLLKQFGTLLFDTGGKILF